MHNISTNATHACSSSFLDIEKKIAWSTWNIFSEITKVFHKLPEFPSGVQEADVSSMETSRFACTTRAARHNVSLHSVNIFLPTRRTLAHIKRSTFLAGHVWRSSVCSSGSTQSPTDRGWELVPIWTTYPRLTRRAKGQLRVVAEKTSCTCKKASLPCT